MLTEGFSAAISAEILSSCQVVFVFQNRCQADDALSKFTLFAEDGYFECEDQEFGKLRVVQQERFVCCAQQQVGLCGT